MKIKKVLTQQLNVLSLPEIRIEAKSNDMGLERKYSILGGVLYIDEKPVHHYFSKNMFFYEDGEEQGSIFLAHHGLTADVIIRKNGKTTLCKASSLLHYEMTYQAEGKEKKLDAAFGMGIDSSRKSYFYCGLKQNGEEIDPSFSYSCLRTMLSSEFYKGTYRGIPYCPSYVSEVRWARLQKISKKNIKNTPSGRIYYFTGMIRCPECGQILAGTGCRSIINRKTGEKRDYCYYRCNRAMIDRICTNRHKVSQNLIETYLLENLEREFEEYKIRVDEIQKKNKQKPKVRTEEQIEKEMSRLNLLFQKDRITWDYYSKEYDALESEKNGLKAIIIEPESDYSSVESLLQKDFLAIYHSLAEENRRTFWRNIIRQIHLKPDYTINYVDFVQSVSV